ncbi:MAG: nitroreductase family protein [Bacilli bacterium]|jgi:nitroreductase
MEVYNTTLKRRSVRRFKENEINDEMIELLLKSAMAAPSACNMQPWEFFVIKNKEILEQLRKTSRYSDRTAPLIIIVAGNDKRSLNHRENDFWIQDCSAAIENILLAATELGLGTCWCGLFPMVTPVKRVRKILNLEEHIIPLALIHIGYPNEELEPRTQYDKKRVHIIE